MSEISGRRVPLRVSNVSDAIKKIWQDYHWPTKTAAGLLLLSCVLGTVLAGWPALEVGSLAGARAFASDGFRTLLTMALGFFVVVNFYLRAQVNDHGDDGTDDIAYALAYEYFKNFMIPALQLANQLGAVLQVFRPTSIDDLQSYASTLEPRIRERFEDAWLPLARVPRPGVPPRSTGLAIRRLRDSRETGTPQHLLFDAPTAVFTLQDVYAAVNVHRGGQSEEPLSAATRLQFQNGQIDSFFRSLDRLFDTIAGLESVEGLVSTTESLSQLRSSLFYVSVSELDERYPAPAQP